MRKFGEVPFPLEPPQESAEHLHDIEMAYHLTLERGCLQVSAAANAAYGLVPLVPGVEKGAATDVAVSSDGPPRARVTLLAPHELTTPPNEMEDDPGVMSAGSRLSLRDGLLDVQISFGKPLDVMTETSIDLMAQLFGGGLPYELNEEDLPMGPNGESLREMLTHQGPQVYAHMFADMTMDVLSSGVARYLEAQAANTRYKQQAIRGKYGLLTSGGIMLATSLAEGRPSLVGVVTAGVNLAVENRRRNKDFREDARRRPEDEARREFLSSLYARSVGEDIHKTFCAAHFEDQVQDPFESPEDNAH